MSTSAQYASTVKAASVALTATANTNRDGATGVYTTIFTAGSSGSRIDDIYIVATGASTTAGVIRLFIHNGTAGFLWQEILVTATTPSTTVAVWSYTLLNQGLVIPTGYSLRASTNNAEGFNVLVTRAGDF
jgi:hypothetical protein